MRLAILTAALFTPLADGSWGLPILCEGQPGVAKTAAIEALAAKHGLPCMTLSPAEHGDGAFGVVPVPEGGVLTFPRPEWTTLFDATGCGLVFVDEITSAPTQLQAAIMGLVLARRIGGYRLPRRVRVIGACNPPELAAGGFDLPAPLANRFGHIQWEPPTVEAHTDFQLNAYANSPHFADPKEAAEPADPSFLEREVLRTWGEAWAWASGIQTAFLARFPEMKNRCPKAGDPNSSKPWSSDRTWHFATAALASSKVHDLSEVDRDDFVSAFIGTAVYEQFVAFIAESDLPAPADVLDGRVTFQHKSSRLDRTAAVLNACVALVAPTTAPKRGDRVEALWALMGEVGKGSSLDIIVPATERLINLSLHGSKAAQPVMAKVYPLLKAAGVTAKKK